MRAKSIPQGMNHNSFSLKIDSVQTVSIHFNHDSFIAYT